MGGSASRTRKITIDNENPTSVIKVSEECVQRIRGRKATAVSSHTATSSALDGPPVAVPPAFYEPSLTSIQLRQENVRNLQENDAYWDQRIKCLQQNHEDIRRVMETEYAKAMDEVAGEKCDESVRKFTEVPCGADRAKIINCYKKYKTEPMRCAKEVQEFAECVDRSTLMVASK